jgi:trigger factor
MENTASTPTNPLERRLDITITRDTLEKATTERVRRMGRNARIPGFRPGKAPLSILHKQFGENARNEALSETLRAAFGEAIKAHNFNVAGLPHITENPDASDDTHLGFFAVFEVYPELTAVNLADAKIERPVLEVGAAEVEQTLEILRKQRIRYAPIDRPAEKEDRVVIDFLGKKTDGEPFQGGTAQDYPFILGRGMMLPDFEDAIMGLKVGEEKTFPLTFPEDYPGKEIAGQTVSFEIKVKQVMAPSLPAVDADFARAMGIEDGDIDKMKAEVEDNLKREVKRRIEARIQTQVMNALLTANPIPVPQALLNMETERLMQEAKKNLEARGMKVENIPGQQDWFAEQARRRVTLGLLFAQIVKQENLSASEDEIKALINDAAETYEKPEEVVSWYYADHHRLANVEALAVEKNVVRWALSRATVTDVPTAFDALMNPTHDA